MKKTRILIVDDDASVTQLLKSVLEVTGAYDVREENYGPNALSATRTFKPDLIFLDVFMPGLGGGDVAAQIAADSTLKNIPVVFLTRAVSQEEAGEKPLLSGGYYFLAKPVNLKGFIHCIETIVPNAPESSEPASRGTSASPTSVL